MWFFIGISDEETAGALGVPAEIVMRDWTAAKQGLLQQLAPDQKK